jgi:hypothetical protein
LGEVRAGGAEGLTSAEAEAWVEDSWVEAVVAAVEPVVAAGDAEAVLRERVAGVTAALFRICADVGCDDITREKSSPMFRVAWQPDISSNPTPMVCVIRPLIVIPSSKHVAKPITNTGHLWPGCDERLNGASPMAVAAKVRF